MIKIMVPPAWGVLLDISLEMHLYTATTVPHGMDSNIYIIQQRPFSRGATIGPKTQDLSVGGAFKRNDQLRTDRSSAA
jgi:hypothetical protein